MKKSTIFLIAALIGTVIMGACSGNSRDEVIEPQVTAVETVANS